MQVTLFPVITGQSGLNPIFQGAAYLGVASDDIEALKVTKSICAPDGFIGTNDP